MKVEIEFVRDIVGHDLNTIRQMYNDWNNSPPTTKNYLSIGDRVLMKNGKTLTVKNLEYNEFLAKEESGYIPKKDIAKNLTPIKQ